MARIQTSWNPMRADMSRRLFVSYAHTHTSAMAERGVPVEAVDWVLDHYVVRRPAPARPNASPTEILIGEYKGRTLKVYIARGSHPPLVKTVAWEGDE